MGSIRPLPRALAWLVTIAATLMLALALESLALNTARIGSWLPLIVFMPWALYLGVWSLRNQGKR